MEFFNFAFSFLGRVSTAEKMLFAKNLSVMLSAGLPLSRALAALERQTKNKKFKKVLDAAAGHIQKGETLSSALEQHPAVFSEFFAAMVKSGERSGKLPESLNLISQQLERDLTLTRRIRGAMMYPLIIIIAMVGIGVLMLIYVVPTLLAVFSELNVQLPLSTRIIIFTSNLFTQYGVWMALGLLFLAGLIFWGLKTKIGRNLLDVVFIHFPFFSSLVKKLNASRATRTLSSLLSSGVDVMEAFDVAQNVVQNHYYKEVLARAKAEVQKGSAIAQIFIREEKLFPALVGEMVAVGEETGQLPSMLLRLADFYEEELSESTKNLTTIIEPALMILIGAVVGFFAVSMIQPMYSMLGSL
jgi:type IV pilus assembly protein PilC